MHIVETNCDHWLSETFARKTIAVVGNSRSLLETPSRGSFIDSCDVVVRMNNFHLIPELTGTKTTIIANSFCPADDPAVDKRMFGLFHDPEIKYQYAMLTVPWTTPITSLKHYTHGELQNNYRNMHRVLSGDNVIAFPYDMHLPIIEKSTQKPSTGASALFLVLQYFRAATVYVTGFSFDNYFGGHYYNVLEERNCHDHNYQNGLVFFIPYFCKPNSNVIVDEYIRRKVNEFIDQM